MSRTIDERVVSMQFDNTHFEKNVATTMSTLDKLKQKLNLTGASEGLNGITTSAKKVDLSAIGDAAEKVGLKFSAMYTIADQYLRRITDSAIHYGNKIVSALTIDPIKTGLSEYETKINAIQVIQANTRGKNSMDDITKALDDLNTYADKTIYNFAQMTSNIGKFTAQGYDVYEAANAVKGLANLAAASGASAEDMARATYQMSQALGGTIKLMDWNSLRNANMATQDLKNTLIDLAKVNGIAVDDMIKKHGTFEQTLQEGWLSGEMFTEAMNIYSGIYSEAELKAKGFTDSQITNFMDLAKTAASAATEVKTVTQLWDVLKETAQSGWTQTWELIIGDFDTAKKMFTDLQVYFSDIINGWSDSRNELLKGWAGLGGRTAMIESFVNVWDGLLSVIKPIKMAFRDIFPETTAKQLYAITDRIRDFTEGLKLSSEQSSKLRTTFKGLFSVIDLGITYAKNIASAFIDILGSFDGLGSAILDVTSSVGEWLISLRKASEESNIFGKVVDTISGFICGLITDVKELAGWFANGFVTTSLDGILGVLSGINDVARSVFDSISDMARGIGSVIANSLREGDIKAVMDLFNSGIFATILLGFKKFSDGLGDSVGTITESFTSLFGVFKDIGEIPKGINDILGSVKDTLVTYQNEIRARTIFTIASAIGILAAAVAVIAMIDSKKLEDSLGAISVLFVELVGSMALFGKLPTAVKGVVKSIMTMVGMSIAINILASALQKVAEIDSDKLFSSVLGLGGLAAIVVGMAKAFSKSSTIVVKGAAQMVIFAAAIGVLAEVCKKLSDLEWNELIRGLTGVGVLMAEVVLFLKYAKFSKEATGTAVGMTILSAAILVLAEACKAFGELDTKVVIQGLIAIGVVLGELAAFTKLTGNANNVISTAAAMVLLGAAMKIFASAVADFGSMPWQQLGLGLLGMAGALTAVTIALRAMPNNVMSIGAGLVIVAASLVILAEALDRMGSLSVTEVVTAIAALAGSLAILATGLRAMNKTLTGSAALTVASVALNVLAEALIAMGAMSGGQLLTAIGALGGSIALLAVGLRAMVGTTSGSAALLVAAAALAVIAVSIKTLGAMDVMSVVIALGALVGVFAIFGVAGLVLAPLVPVLQGLGVAIVLFGAGCLAAGVGIAAFGTGLVMLATGGTQAVDMLMKAITGVVDLIPTIASKIADGIVQFARIISDGAPALGECLISLVTTAVDVLKKTAPAIAEGTLDLILSALEMFAKYAPKIVEFLAEFLISVIDALATHIPELVKSAVNLIAAFFQGVVDALSAIDIDTLLKAIAGVGLLSGLMFALSAIVPTIPSAMAGTLGLGVVVAELAIVLAAIGALAQIPGIKWLIDKGGDLLEQIGTAIGQFVGGIVGGIAKGATSTLPDIGKNLSKFMENVEPFIEGAKDIDASTLEGVKKLASVILTLTAANLIDSITRFLTGGSSLSDFGKELAKFGPYFKKYADSVSGINPAVVTASANAAKSLAEMARSLPNKGGIISWFTGDNSLAEFADELVPFGKSMKKYSDSVAGVNSAVVTASTHSAKSLSELAKNLPNKGGMVSWFTGDNDLASFGTSLVSFGKNFAKYAEYMSGVDSSVLTATTAAANSIVKLQKSLPDKGGWFSDDMTLTDFGSDMSSFGKKIAAYYSSISCIDVTKMSSTITQTERLVSMVKGMSGIDTSGASSFVTALNTLAQNGIAGFVTAFTGSASRATSAVATFINAAVNGIKNKNAQFNSAGQAMITSLIAGIRDKDSGVSSAMTNIVSGALTKIKNKSSEFNSTGQALLTNLISGIRAKESGVSSAAANVINNVLTAIKGKNSEFNSAGQGLMNYLINGFKSQDSALSSTATNTVSGALTNITSKTSSFRDAGSALIENLRLGIADGADSVKLESATIASASAKQTRNYYDSFYNAGAYLVKGFAEGISENTWRAEAKARAMANAAYNAAMNALDAHSPSRVFIEVGSYVARGFAMGIGNNAKYSTIAASDMATSTIDAVKGAIARIGAAVDASIDVNPTIRPVLDLSEVESGAGRLQALFSHRQAVAVSTGIQQSARAESPSEATVARAGNTYQFTQNNYSPKALTRDEIYRQTKNQFSAMERMVEA